MGELSMFESRRKEVHGGEIKDAHRGGRNNCESKVLQQVGKNDPKNRWKVYFNILLWRGS